MKIIGVIPARYQSSRFPGKPLQPILGKPLILWVCEIVEKALGRENTYVATDDDRIAKTVTDAGYQSVMTSSNHNTGTDRLVEVSEIVAADFYINVQGDEPMVDPNDILRLVEMKKQNPNCIVNCMARLKPNEDPTSPHLPKVVTDEENNLLYMSRSAIPGNKNGSYDPTAFFKQVCIYAFNKEELGMMKGHPDKTRLESHEDIEILRFVELGRKVIMLEVDAGSLAVDVPEDVKKVEDALSN